MKTLLGVLFGLCLLILLSPYLLNSPIAWPIERVFERRTIYKTARGRVTLAGGWSVVEQACLSYATNGFTEDHQHESYYFHGKRFSTNALPKTIDALQPMFVRMERDKKGMPILQLTFSVGHRTGSYDAPYYSIWVVCTNHGNYVPDPPIGFRGAQGLLERKGSAIFEAR